jgi:hypothetical protein
MSVMLSNQNSAATATRQTPTEAANNNFSQRTVQKNNLADAVDQKASASKPGALGDACFKLHAKIVCVYGCEGVGM